MKQSAKYLTLGAAAAGVCAAVFSFLALNGDYDIFTQHFAAGSPTALCAMLFCILGVLLVGGAAFVSRSDGTLVPVNGGGFVTFAACMTSFMLCANIVFTLLGGLPGKLEIAQLICAAVSVVYFFLASSPKKAHSVACAALSLFPILYAMLGVLVAYFDKNYAMNAELKTYMLLLYLSMGLFFCADSRFVQRRMRVVQFILSAGVCIVFGAAVGLSRLAVALFDTVGHNFPLLEAASFVAAALYAAARLFSLRPAEEIAEEDAADADPSAADAEAETEAEADAQQSADEAGSPEAPKDE